MIRPATPADVPAMASVFLRSWDAALPTVARAHPDAALPAYLREVVLGTMEAYVWDDGELAGWMALDGGWIAQLYLAPERRGERIGAAFVALAQEQRPDGLQLWTFAVNGPARRFYRRQGFTEAEHTDGARNEEREPDVRCVWRASKRPMRDASTPC